MSYYVLKHSAKGTTWGEHKYIRKEGNRYIYPEDVKKSANDNIEKQKELNEENTENDTRYEKALNDYLKTISKDLNVYTITEYEHEKLYKNDPKYKELSDLFDEEYYRVSEAKQNAKNEKRDYINKASENKQNRILSEAKEAAENAKKKDILSKTDPRFKYTIKRKSDPADRYKVVSNNTRLQREHKKYLPYGSDAKYAKEADRVIEIAKRKRGIKDKDKLASRATAKYMKRTRARYR